MYGDRGAFSRTPAWHQLGTVFQGAKTLKEIITLAKCDYALTAEPIYVMLDGNYIDCNDRVAIVRHANYDDPTPVVLEVVSSSYQLVTNLQLVEYYNELSERYSVETMGALRNGATFFFTLDAGEVEINGGLVHQYFLVTDNKTATQQTRIVYTPVKVVCQNTLTTGLRQATFNMGVPHRTGNHERLQEIAGLVVQMEDGIQQVNKLFGDMGKSYVKLEEFKELVEQLYPIDDDET